MRRCCTTSGCCLWIGSSFYGVSISKRINASQSFYVSVDTANRATASVFAENLAEECAKGCIGQELIGDFTGQSTIVYLNESNECYQQNITWESEKILVYDIKGDAEYSYKWNGTCWISDDGDVDHEVNILIDSCPDMLLNIECNGTEQNAYLIIKPNSPCIEEGLKELKKRFGYDVLPTEVDCPK